MYTQEIIEAMSYIMGARDSNYNMTFGVGFPILLRQCDRDDVQELRSAFLTRNSIMLSLRYDSYTRLYYYKKTSSDCSDTSCVNLSASDVMLQLKTSEDIIRDRISLLNMCKVIEPHYSVILSFILFEVKSIQQLMGLRDKVSKYPQFPLGIYIPRFEGVKDFAIIRYMFKNDYLFLKTIYKMAGRKINMYLDYYKNSSSEELLKVDEVITASKNYEIFIDCDNAHSAYTYLFLMHVSKLPSVKRINLFYCDDLAFRWELLRGSNIFKTPVERVIACKNSCDIVLSNKIAEAIYTRNCKDVMIVSCDSDYYSIINSVTDVTYTVLTTDCVSKQYVSKLNYRGVKTFNLQKMFDIADVIARINAKTSYYTDLVAAMMYDGEDL